MHHIRFIWQTDSEQQMVGSRLTHNPGAAKSCVGGEISVALKRSTTVRYHLPWECEGESV
jgi:hypothetical protein